ncbi:zwei Ig domain protein zig-4-like [Brevipalpus obovatus]|uniref:zwei Ig domain protein zig-4-like n=1 Tax=Brevipalpus obovatus TaxID=246614 RepID=UPI003D9E4F91
MSLAQSMDRSIKSSIGGTVHLNISTTSLLSTGFILILLISSCFHVDAAIGPAKMASPREGLKSNTLVRLTKTKPSQANRINQDKLSKDGFLRIREEPPKELITIMGSSHVLTCEAQGSPPPKIYWLKDGYKLPQSLDDLVKITEETADGAKGNTLGLSLSVSRLFLDCLSPRDAGQYTCVAETPYLKAISHTHVEVEADGSRLAEATCLNREPAALATSTRIYMWTSTRLETIGNSVILFCRAEGIPIPRIKWLGPDDQPLPHRSNRYEVLSDGDLYIRNIRWADMGGYTCIAENEFGQDKVVTFLYPTKSDNHH